MRRPIGLIRKVLISLLTFAAEYCEEFQMGGEELDGQQVMEKGVRSLREQREAVSSLNR